MKAKHCRTLEAIFATPTRGSIPFSEIEALMLTLGATIREGERLRIVFELNGKREYLHRPHPGKEVKKGYVYVKR